MLLAAAAAITPRWSYAFLGRERRECKMCFRARRYRLPIQLRQQAQCHHMLRDDL
jgi:hypothetical protein